MARKSETITCPFVILIDTAEGIPFTFQNLKADADQGHKPIVVTTEFTCLGRHPNSMGDYSIAGFIGQVGIERKSMEDAQSTILGWDGRRDRFECELENLAKMEAGLVVVECSFEQLIQEAPEYGQRTKSANAKSLMRSVLAFQQDYKVPWLFAGGRRLAEISTFRFLQRFHEKQKAHAEVGGLKNDD